MNPRFPAPYVFQEYPKALYHPVDKSMSIVESAEEEEAVKALWDVPEKRGPGRPRKNP